jgi:hypothetical protein
MARWAAECETPNSGLIRRMGKFVRQYTATRNTRPGKVSAHGRPADPHAFRKDGG